MKLSNLAYLFGAVPLAALVAGLVLFTFAIVGAAAAPATPTCPVPQVTDGSIVVNCYDLGNGVACYSAGYAWGICLKVR